MATFIALLHGTSYAVAERIECEQKFARKDLIIDHNNPVVIINTWAAYMGHNAFKLMKCKSEIHRKAKITN